VDTKTAVVKENTLVIPSLPQEVLFKLPRYCPQSNKDNLATQYYYWNRELIKDNQKLQKENQRLNEENQQLKEERTRLEKEKEQLRLERDKYLRMIFKPKGKKQIIVKPEPELRTKESYIRPLPQSIDEEKEAILKQCPHCSHELSLKVSSYQRIIEDIPSTEELKARVTQYTINRYYCRYCKKIISARPKEVLPHSRLGINTLLYVLYAKYRLRLPQGLIKENLSTCFNLKVSEGELNNLLSKGHEAFKDKWQEIIEVIKHSDTVHADETSWRVNGDNHWLWTFVTNKAIRYTISQSRGKGVAQEILGDNYQGTVVSDFYAAYSQFKHKQRCWVHLLRKARELVQQKLTLQRKQVNRKLNRIYQQILFVRKTGKPRVRKARQITDKLLALCRIKTTDQELQKMLNLCSRFAGELVACVSNHDVSPDNNIAERALRPLVVMRKISGGSRSKQGAFISEVNMSVMETLRKQKQLFPAMRELVLNYIASNG
jgi:transposase